MTRMVDFRKMISAAGAVFALLLVAGTASVQAQDTGAPPWGEFLRQFKRDKLLKKPYHMEPAEGDLAGPKGLASKIRARELDVGNVGQRVGDNEGAALVGERPDRLGDFLLAGVIEFFQSHAHRSVAVREVDANRG